MKFSLVEVIISGIVLFAATLGTAYYFDFSNTTEIQSITAIIMLLGLAISYAQLVSSQKSNQNHLEQSHQQFLQQQKDSADDLKNVLEQDRKHFEQGINANIKLLETELAKSDENLKKNHILSKKQFTLSEIDRTKLNVTPYIQVLYEREELHYIERKRTEPYDLRLLHKIICDDEDYNSKSKDLSPTEEGKKVKTAIMKLLNHYEYFAIGIHERVFDEEIVKRSLQGALKKAYYVFKPYIDHLRGPNHYNNDKILIDLENLVKEWDKVEVHKAKETYES